MENYENYDQFYLLDISINSIIKTYWNKILLNLLLTICVHSK